jgi:hypothetical protein
MLDWFQRFVCQNFRENKLASKRRTTWLNVTAKFKAWKSANSVQQSDNECLGNLWELQSRIAGEIVCQKWWFL